MHYSLRAFGADTIVISVRNGTFHKKILQINFKSRDGSIFVSLPYVRLGVGRLGILEVPPGTPNSVQFGNQTSFTTHSVKYTHHPDGNAHFSQDGKIFTKIRKRSVPLASGSGHLFTAMVQGLEHFDDAEPTSSPSRKRQLVPIPLPEGTVAAVKLVAHLYSAQAVARRIQQPSMDSALVPVQRPDGTRTVGAVLATRVFRDGNPHLLLVTADPIERVAPSQDCFFMFMGGFDPPATAFDHSQTLRLLMMLYPDATDLNWLKANLSCLDLP
jgi:hypothetical protein